ncbi:MAG: hypothetical protein Q8L86_01480 [Vicinamibacterales bacterium]|nr:hypothetical protein [Vicinamibacterales bacterium]
MLDALLLPLSGPLWPREALRPYSKTQPLLVVVVGLLVATVASAAWLIPFMLATIQTSGVPVEEGLAWRIVVLNIGAFAPVGALASATVMAGLLWTFPVFGGFETEWRTCFLIAAVTQGVEIFRRLLVAIVLWARELTGAPGSAVEVRTGFDAVLALAGDLPDVVMLVGRHFGPFEVWSVAIATAGLMVLQRLPLRTAAITASVTVVVIQGTVALFELLVR